MSPDREMRIAIIGGGRRCRSFLEMLDAELCPQLRARIVAVADLNENAEGIRLARERGIFTTGDYRDFYAIPDLDLVIELTGNEELLKDFMKNNPARVRVLESAISRLFGDILRLRAQYLFRTRQVELIEGIISSLFSSLRDWVLVLQPDLRILDANEAFLDAVRSPKEELTGKYCYQAAYGLNEQCSGSALACPVRECLETGMVAHAIHERTMPDGRLRYNEVSAVPWRAADGKIQAVIEIFRDITDELEKKFEQRSRALKRDLIRLIHEDKMISLGKLVASAMHEINNPLSGINSLALLMQEEIKSDTPWEENKEKFLYYLNLIGTESARCSTIVSDLLSFSRQKRGARVPIELNELVRKTHSFIGHRLEMQKIGSVLNLAPELPPIHGEGRQIHQCLLNVILNAVESMPDGGTLTISTVHNRQSRQVELNVADTGTGIPKEDMSRIFEPFFSTKSEDKGVGLGLSVVYGIVKEHGGSIWVQSEPGEGALFQLRFPEMAEPDLD
jgi:two-component system, NtrC family, sensor kinase